MYITLWRRYRPRHFDDLKGQDVLVKVVTYALTNSNLPSGYLFTGIRGVGKTTSARIIARLINCENKEIREQSIYACEKCPNCLSNMNHPDIIEIDAASRTSVENIREIIESAKYKPLLGKYKVFIIDEVHMLSNNAFNAFLKTLEEPPDNVLFILATTEINKVPLTIISRCQRFDLRRLKISELIGLLKDISQKEGIEYDDDALKIIAYKADGSARDAISLFDQAHTLSHKHKISAKIIYDMIGSISIAEVIELFKLITNEDSKEAIKVLNQLYSNSIDLISVLEELINVVGYIIKIKVDPTISSEIYKEFFDDLERIARLYSLERISILWQILINGIIEIKSSHMQLLTSEILIIKAIHACHLHSVMEEEP